MVPVGSQIQLVVEKIENIRHTRKWAREFVARVWNPLSTEKIAYSIVFRSAGLELPDGRIAALNVSFGRLLRLSKYNQDPAKILECLNRRVSKRMEAREFNPLDRHLDWKKASKAAPWFSVL